MRRSWVIEFTYVLPEPSKETIGPFVDKRAAWAWGVHWLGKDNESWRIMLSPTRADSLPSEVEKYIKDHD